MHDITSNSDLQLQAHQHANAEASEVADKQAPEIALKLCVAAYKIASEWDYGLPVGKFTKVISNTAHDLARELIYDRAYELRYRSKYDAVVRDAKQAQLKARKAANEQEREVLAGLIDRAAAVDCRIEKCDPDKNMPPDCRGKYRLADAQTGCDMLAPGVNLIVIEDQITKIEHERAQEKLEQAQEPTDKAEQFYELERQQEQLEQEQFEAELAQALRQDESSRQAPSFVRLKRAVYSAFVRAIEPPEGRS